MLGTNNSGNSFSDIWKAIDTVMSTPAKRSAFHERYTIISKDGKQLPVIVEKVALLVLALITCKSPALTRSLFRAQAQSSAPGNEKVMRSSSISLITNFARRLEIKEDESPEVHIQRLECLLEKESQELSLKRSGSELEEAKKKSSQANEELQSISDKISSNNEAIQVNAKSIEDNEFFIKILTKCYDAQNKIEDWKAKISGSSQDKKSPVDKEEINTLSISKNLAQYDKKFWLEKFNQEFPNYTTIDGQSIDEVDAKTIGDELATPRKKECESKKMIKTLEAENKDLEIEKHSQETKVLTMNLACKELERQIGLLEQHIEHINEALKKARNKSTDSGGLSSTGAIDV